MANLQAELKQFFQRQLLRTWLGVVKASEKKNATRVRVYHYVLDERLNAYFREHKDYFAYDPVKDCKVGDTVLISELASKKTSLITHELLKIVYRFGDMVDPITGKKVMRMSEFDPRFREDVDKIIDVYGPSPNRFIYEKAPPRGWQEGKRDFTDKIVTTRYHDDGKEDSYQVHLQRNFSKPEYKWPK